MRGFAKVGLPLWSPKWQIGQSRSFFGCSHLLGRPAVNVNVINPAMSQVNASQLFGEYEGCQLDRGTYHVRVNSCAETELTSVQTVATEANWDKHYTIREQAPRNMCLIDVR